MYYEKLLTPRFWEEQLAHPAKKRKDKYLITYYNLNDELFKQTHFLTQFFF